MSPNIKREANISDSQDNTSIMSKLENSLSKYEFKIKEICL